MNHDLKSGLPFALAMVCLFQSAAAPAMGTPPQKSARSAEAGVDAVMLQADALRAAPDAASAVLLHLEKGTRVRLLASQGGWSQLASAGKIGWVRVLAVSSHARDRIELSDLGALGKTPQGKVVAVAGARGLDEENLKIASYDPLEVERLHGYAISRAEAEQFALAAGLQARALPYFSAPANRQSPGADSPWKEY